MNVLQLSYSTSGRTFSVHLQIQKTPLTLEIDHPLVNLWSHLWRSFSKTWEFGPLYIVDNGKEEAQVPEPKLLTQVKEGLRHHVPEPIEDGVNGAYFLKNEEGENIAVFKPKEEEGNKSPKKSKDEEKVLDRGIYDGEGIQREVAAYYLDKDHFAGVPETLIAELEINGVNQIGSLQRFVDNDGSSWDMGPSKFPVKQVHKIGILDLRIHNNDRHGGNILFKENEEDGQIELIPIDHGLSLSHSFEHAWFDWISWPQAKVPFDKETLNYIESIDIQSDARLLKTLGIREECIRTMIISSTLLKKGAAAGLTLYEIASMASRTDLMESSKLEDMFEMATKEAKTEEELYTIMWSLMDEEIAKAKPVQ
jgi:hypothetical protein